VEGERIGWVVAVQSLVQGADRPAEEGQNYLPAWEAEAEIDPAAVVV
jgi:hypothetical protein